MYLVLVADGEALVSADPLVVLQAWNERAVARVDDDPPRLRQVHASSRDTDCRYSYRLVWIQQRADVRDVPDQPAGVVCDAPQADVGEPDVGLQLPDDRVGKELRAHLTATHGSRASMSNCVRGE